jgi:hypothetical protein
VIAHHKKGGHKVRKLGQMFFVGVKLYNGLVLPPSAVQHYITRYNRQIEI